MNITLIGMAGAGKSYFGKKLAKRFGLEFLDIDRMVLEPAHQKPLQQILDELRDEAFMRWEEQMVIGATRGRDGLLISPGGSVVYEKDAMTHLEKISSIVYLQTPFPIIEKRVGATPRGIVGLGKKTLRELYDERHALYQAYADLTVEPERLSIPEFVAIVGNFVGIDPVRELVSRATQR